MKEMRMPRRATSCRYKCISGCGKAPGLSKSVSNCVTLNGFPDESLDPC